MILVYSITAAGWQGKQTAALFSLSVVPIQSCAAKNLLLQLKVILISDYYFHLVASCLRDRIFRVNIDRALNMGKHITVDVPQGSRPSPVLVVR